jgi:ABC-type branched-subunit amino acid transport system substrate-binding protein
LALVTASALLAASACSSGSSGASSTAENSAGTGGAINVMAFGQFQASTFAFPESLIGMQAQINHINSSGGIGQRKVNLIVCNDQGDPNVAASCGRQAISDHVVAVIAGWSNQGPSILPILSTAGIPYIGSELNTTTDLTSTNVFAPDPGIAAASFGQGAIAVSEKCTKVAVLVNTLPSSQLAGAENVAAVNAAGGKVTLQLSVPDTLPSYSAQIDRIASSGAQCLIPQVTPTEIPKVFTAISSSSNPHLPIIIESPEAAVLQPVGAAANGTIVESGSYLPPNPNLSQFLSQFKAQSSTATVSSFAIDGWTSALIFTNIAKTLGTITSSSVSDALGKVRNMAVGTYLPVTFAPNSVAQFRNLSQPNVFAYIYNNGNLTLALKEPVNIQAGIAAYAKSGG